VQRAEAYVQGFAYWNSPKKGMKLAMIIGSRLDDDALGAVKELTPEMRQKLAEPGTVIIDENEREDLGIPPEGGTAEVAGRRVRVVDFVKGLKGLTGPFVFCSITTARPLLRMPPDQVTYFLAQCRDPADIPRVKAALHDPSAGGLKQMARTADEFALDSKVYWLRKTQGGMAMGLVAILGLLVGVVVTSQTLFAAMQASQREFAVLRALGIPRWRMGALVLAQSLGVSAIGVALALPVVYATQHLTARLGAPFDLVWWIIPMTVAGTVGVAGVAGLAALRSLRLIEPANLLR
jgi:putative ABC transport system permease protein